MKRLGVFFLVLMFAVLACADFEVYDINIEKSYPRNQILTGEINITLDDVSADFLITSNFGHEVSIKDLLDFNAAVYDCVPNECSSGYVVESSGSSLTFDMSAYDKKILGFLINGSVAEGNEVDMDISSDFDEGTVVPLSITFFEDSANKWSFSNYSSEPDAIRPPNYGFYRDNEGVLSSPLINGKFCSKRYVQKTDRINVGVDVVPESKIGAIGNLSINVFNDLGVPVVNKPASFNPNTCQGAVCLNSVFFDAEYDSLFSAGNYYFCVSSENTTAGYRIYVDESSGTHSGFNYRNFENEFANASNSEKTKSYSIFIQEAIFANADALTGTKFTGYFEQLDNFILTKYDRDCSNGCYIPFEFTSGVNQKLTVSDGTLIYYADGMEDISNTLYEFSSTPAKVSYSGVLDLSVLELRMNESGLFKLYIDDEKILEENVKITSAPLINGIFPSEVPAGISAALFAEIDYDSNSSSLTYEWDFGDGSTQTTNTNKVFHTYNNVSQWNVKLVVKDGNLSNSYETKISSVNPRVYVELIYNRLSNSINESLDAIKSFPAWQQPVLEKALDVVNTEDELKRIKRKMDEAVLDDDYLEIAKLISDLDLPRLVFVSETYDFDFPLVEYINYKAIASYTNQPADEGDDEAYQNAVALWQDQNARFTVNYKKISLLRTSGLMEDILLSYFITVANDYPYDSFFVIDAPREDLVFNNLDREPKSYEGATIFPMTSGQKSFEFYVLGSEEIDFFASPEIKELNLLLNQEVTDDCNFNYVCEEGEDHNTCRTDCKPVSYMIIYIILAALLGLIVYTLIQIWYLKYYENTLFKDKNRLYNLLMYVTAAQNKGMSREDIKKSLREKGWTSERIEFVIRKANGERIGLYEIIPISKFMAHSRKKQVIKNKGVPLQRLVPGSPFGVGRLPPGSHDRGMSQGKGGPVHGGSSGRGDLEKGDSSGKGGFEKGDSSSATSFK